MGRVKSGVRWKPQAPNRRSNMNFSFLIDSTSKFV